MPDFHFFFPNLKMLHQPCGSHLKLQLLSKLKQENGLFLGRFSETISKAKQTTTPISEEEVAKVVAFSEH